MNKMMKILKQHRAYMIFTIIQIVIFLGLLIMSIRPAGNVKLEFGENVTSGSVELPYGAYEVNINYKITEWDNYVGMGFVMKAEKAPTYFYYSSAQLDTDSDSVTTLCWINNVLGREHIDFGFEAYTGNEEAEILSVSFSEKISYRILVVLGFLLFMAALNIGVYYFLIKENAVHKMSAVGICFIIFSSSILLVSRYIYDGCPDLGFHLNRIVAIAQGIREGDWRIYIQPHMMNGYGYATPIYYPQLFLYIPAILYSLYVPLYVSYYIYIFVVNVATCLIAWYSFGRIANNRRITFAVSTMYCLSLYRFTDIYSRSAVGEYTALTFLPLIIYGLYRIYEKDSKMLKFADLLPLVFGVTGVVQCHVLSIEMSAVFIGLSALIMFKKTFEKKRFVMLVLAVILAALLNFGVLYILFKGMQLDVEISSRVEEGNIQNQGIVLAQLFTIFGDAEGTSNSVGTCHDIAFAPGFGIIAGCGLMLWVIINRKKYVSDKNASHYKRGVIGLVLTLFAILLSTQLFPWDAIGATYKLRKIEALLSMVQFPWRYMMIVIACGCYTTAEALIILAQSSDNKNLKYIEVLMIILTFISSAYFCNSYLYNMENTYIYSEYDCNNRLIGTFEYLPSHASDQIADNTDLIYDSSSLNISGYEYEGKGVTGFDVVNNAGESNVTLPIYYYKGYAAYDSVTGQNFTIIDDVRKTITVVIPEGYSGRVNVRFIAPVKWRIAELISLLSLIGIVAAYVITNRKKVSD